MTNYMKKYLLLIALGMLILASGAYGAGSGGTYPYLGKTFRTFVQDSYTEGHKGKPEQFYTWFDNAFAQYAPEYKGVNTSELPKFLNAEKIRIQAIKNPSTRAAEELKLGAYLHSVIKKTIRKFSLDRGFEFHAVERLGERQCLLQAVLIAGLLQQMGAKAGVVMVYRNITGQYSFNGHVATLLRLSDGKDIIVDASDPIPFVKQQGILAQTKKYGYLTPVYAKDSSQISAYRTNFGKQVKTSEVTPLDVKYVRSQFYYYRGERAPGGVLAPKKTEAGLTASAYFLEKSVKYSPANALATYMLGKTYTDQGKPDKALIQYQKALKLQQSYGWVPQGIKSALSKDQK